MMDVNAGTELMEHMMFVKLRREVIQTKVDDQSGESGKR